MGITTSSGFGKLNSHVFFTWLDSTTTSNRHIFLRLNDQVFQRKIDEESVSFTSKSASEGGDIFAPVPGKIIKIMIKNGDLIEKGQTVIILESMKMEFEVKASGSGKVGKIVVEDGEQVEADQLLANLLN